TTGGTGGTGGTHTMGPATSASTTGAGAGTTTTTTAHASSGTATSSGGNGTDTWGNYAQGFFATYCVECHSPTVNPVNDFTQYAMAKKFAPIIRCGVAPTLLSGCSGSPPPKQFPIFDSTKSNPKPSDAERDRIVAWI